MIRYWPAKLWSAKKPQEAIKPTYNNNEQLAFGSKTPNRNVSLIVNHQFACVEAGKNTVVRNDTTRPKLINSFKGSGETTNVITYF